MTCENNPPNPFLPVIPDPYDSLTDGVAQFEKAAGGATQTFGALGKLSGPVNNYDTLVNDIYNRAPWTQYAVDVSGMVGATLGTEGAI
jgi:hypothetical protein